MMPLSMKRKAWEPVLNEIFHPQHLHYTVEENIPEAFSKNFACPI